MSVSGVFSSEHIASWYILQDAVSPTIQYIFKEFSEDNLQEAKKVEMLQGDIGVRVMDIGATQYTYDISSPALILQQPDDITTPVDRVLSSLDLLAYVCGVVGVPYSETNIPLYFVTEGSLTLNKDVNVTLHIESPSGEAFIPVYAPTVQNWHARTAKWYDCKLVFDTPWMNQKGFNVSEFKMNFKFKVDKQVFIGSGQTPYMAYQGYDVSGTIKFLIPPTLVDTYRAEMLPLQTPGNLVGTTWANTLSVPTSPPQQVWLRVGNETNGIQLALGRTLISTNLHRALNPSEPTYATVSFNNYVNTSAPIVTAHPVNSPFG